MNTIKLSSQEDLDAVTQSWDRRIEDIAIEMMSLVDADGLHYATMGKRMVDGYRADVADIRSIFQHGKFGVKR